MPEAVSFVDGEGSAVYPFISVILPVRCEFRGLSLLLPDLLSQDYPVGRWEIIVADGASTDGTSALVDQYAKNAAVPIRLIENRGIRSSAGRNVGIAAAQGEIIIFIDGHCRVHSRSLLSDTVRIFEESGAACLCRPQPLSGSPDHPMSFKIAEIRRSSFGHGRGSMIYNLEFRGFVDPRSSGVSYRRSVFEDLGLYDETFDACEDVELNTRVALSGMRAYSDPRLAVHYQARASLAGLAKQMMRYGRGRIRLARKHKGERSFSSMAPLFLCLSFLAPVVIALLAPVFVWKHRGLFLIASLPFVVYATAVFVATLQVMTKTRKPQLVWGLVIYPVIHLGLGIGMLIEAVSPGRPTRRSA